MRALLLSFALLAGASCGKAKPDPHAGWPRLHLFAGEFNFCAQQSQTPWVVDDPLALVEMGLPSTSPAHVMVARCKNPMPPRDNPLQGVEMGIFSTPRTEAKAARSRHPEAFGDGSELEILYDPNDERIFQMKARSDAEFFDGIAEHLVHVSATRPPQHPWQRRPKLPKARV